MKQGQVLILLLLIVVVILALGLSVASRNITNLRTSTQTENSQRAFSAAEGGVEDVLSNLDEIGLIIGTTNAPPPGTNCSSSVGSDVATCGVDIGGLTANVNVASSNVYEAPIRLGNVAQVDVESLATGNVKIEWAIKDDPLESVTDGPASVEISLVYGSSPNYAVERWYFRGDLGRSDETGDFTISGAASNCVPSSEFEKCANIDISGFLNHRVIRIRPFWVKTTARVAGADFDLPLQTYEVSSTAQTDIGVARSLEVVRSALPQVPAVFDFALYSETDIVK